MSDSRFLRLPTAALLAVALLTAPALAGCGALPIPSIGDVGSGSDPGGDGGVEVGIPADFPAEVPLIEGEVLSGVSVAGIWSVVIKVDDGSAFEQITDQLEAAGFVSSGLGGSTELGSTGVFNKPPYAISIMVSGGSDEGWVAKYTVTEAVS